jgi:hypothetical protein
MVKRGASFFDVCLRVRPQSSLEERSECKQKLSEGEKQNRRSPERLRKNA